MHVILFRSRQTDAVGEEYDQTERHLAQKVRAHFGGDLVGLKNYVAEDGERLAVVWWRNAETLDEWRADSEHQEAQQRGRDEWYSFYELSVAEISRTSSSESSDAYPTL